MFLYDVTFIHKYWRIITTVEHWDGISAHWYDEVQEIAIDKIMSTSGLDLTKFSFVYIDVDYVGEA